MDCGTCVKIGVSGNVENRKNQIPFKVKQYFCTEPIENAFDIESFLHHILKPVVEHNGIGREYFNINFDIACEILNISIVSDEKRKKAVDRAIKYLFASEKMGNKFDNDFYEFISAILKLPLEDLVLIDSFANGLLRRKMIMEYKQNKEVKI